MKSPKSVNRFMFLFLLWEMLPLQLLLFIPAIIQDMWFPKLSDSRYYINLLIVQDLFLLLLPILLGLYIYRGRIEEIIYFRGLSLWNVIYIAMMGFLMMPIMTFISAVTSVFCPDMNVEVEAAVMEAPLMVSFLVMGVLPAIFEETVFRGFVFGMARHFSVKKAIVLSAFYFGLFHLNGYQIPYAFFAGVILALVVYATGSLFSSMLLHLIINGSQVALSHAIAAQPELMSAAETFTPGFGDYVSLGVTALVFAVLLALMIKGFLRYNKKYNKFYGLPKPEQQEENEAPKKFIDIYFIGCIAAFILYSIIMKLIENLLV